MCSAGAGATPTAAALPASIPHARDRAQTLLVRATSLPVALRVTSRDRCLTSLPTSLAPNVATADLAKLVTKVANGLVCTGRRHRSASYAELRTARLPGP
jgi:hypothetical protein